MCHVVSDHNTPSPLPAHTLLLNKCACHSHISSDVYYSDKYTFDIFFCLYLVCLFVCFCVYTNNSSVFPFLFFSLCVYFFPTFIFFSLFFNHLFIIILSLLSFYLLSYYYYFSFIYLFIFWGEGEVSLIYLFIYLFIFYFLLSIFYFYLLFFFFRDLFYKWENMQWNNNWLCVLLGFFCVCVGRRSGLVGVL